MLDYTTEENDLTENPDNFRAQVTNVTSYTQEEIVNRIMNIGAGLTRSDVVSVLEAEKQVMAGIIAEGSAINTELFNAFPSIHGVFTSPADPVDGVTRKVKCNLHAGTALRDAVKQVRTRHITAAAKGPVITTVTDVKTGSMNNLLTPGRDVRIAGVKLRIAGEEAFIGLFFVPPGGEPIKVDPSDIVVNNHAELIACIPPLPAGTYQVRIITQYSGSGRFLKTAHTETFNKLLTVG
ncbi:hypothetical protein AGMMS49944_31950 [Spirochaetia bacterium]|nr:hypothetical protein AGMMS49944_31950 [Spirochaetia bacterium]